MGTSDEGDAAGSAASTSAPTPAFRNLYVTKAPGLPHGTATRTESSVSKDDGKRDSLFPNISSGPKYPRLGLSYLRAKMDVAKRRRERSRSSPRRGPSPDYRRLPKGIFLGRKIRGTSSSG